MAVDDGVDWELDPTGRGHRDRRVDDDRLGGTRDEQGVTGGVGAECFSGEQRDAIGE